MKYKIIIPSLLCVVALFASCNEDHEFPTLPATPDDEMHVKGSAENVVLDENNPAGTAITFSWDAVHNPIDANDVPTYSICFYSTSDKDNTKTEFIQLGTEQSFSITHAALNKYVSRWIDAGHEIRVTAEVIGTFNSEIKYVKPEISLYEFTATAYERFPKNIYMHITDEVTNATTIETLTESSKGSGIYYVDLTDLGASSYYFTLYNNADYPAYGAKNETALLEYMEGTPKQFTFNGSGNRKVIVDLNDDYLDCRLFDIIDLPNGWLWIVGNGTSVDWNPVNEAGMFVAEGGERDPYIYSWTGQFKEGEFKVGLGNDNWSGLYFFAAEANADPIKDNSLREPRLEADGGDIKWASTVNGTYKLTFYLDRSNLHLTFEEVKEE